MGSVTGVVKTLLPAVASDDAASTRQSNVILVRKWLYHSRPSNWWFPRQNCGGSGLLSSTKFLPRSIQSQNWSGWIPAKIGNVKTSLKIRISIIGKFGVWWRFCCQSPEVKLGEIGIQSRKKKSPKIDQNDPHWNWAKKCLLSWMSRRAMYLSSIENQSKNEDNGRRKKFYCYPPF